MNPTQTVESYWNNRWDPVGSVFSVGSKDHERFGLKDTIELMAAHSQEAQQRDADHRPKQVHVKLYYKTTTGAFFDHLLEFLQLCGTEKLTFGSLEYDASEDEEEQNSFMRGEGILRFASNLHTVSSLNQLCIGDIRWKAPMLRRIFAAPECKITEFDFWVPSDASNDPCFAVEMADALRPAHSLQCVDAECDIFDSHQSSILGALENCANLRVVGIHAVEIRGDEAVLALAPVISRFKHCEEFYIDGEDPNGVSCESVCCLMDAARQHQALERLRISVTLNTNEHFLAKAALFMSDMFQGKMTRLRHVLFDFGSFQRCDEKRGWQLTLHSDASRFLRAFNDASAGLQSQAKPLHLCLWCEIPETHLVPSHLFSLSITNFRGTVENWNGIGVIIQNQRSLQKLHLRPLDHFGGGTDLPQSITARCSALRGALVKSHKGLRSLEFYAQTKATAESFLMTLEMTEVEEVRLDYTEGVSGPLNMKFVAQKVTKAKFLKSLSLSRRRAGSPTFDFNAISQDRMNLEKELWANTHIQMVKMTKFSDPCSSTDLEEMTWPLLVRNTCIAHVAAFAKNAIHIPRGHVPYIFKSFGYAQEGASTPTFLFLRDCVEAYT